jgi:hypothetical protein
MSNTNNTSGPAFPTESAQQTGTHTWRYEGTTLRDYFAAEAMQGWLATYPNDMAVQDVSPTKIADFAYEMADAMLEAREA